MSFADQYISKQTSVYQVSVPVQEDLGICITIPCYNEPKLTKSLDALWNCNRPECSVEVIIIVNSGENSPTDALLQNEKSIEEFKTWRATHNDSRLNFHLIHITQVPHKFAGVGTARKTAMDAATLRFNSLNRPNGVIAGYDADSLCDSNYLTELESKFYRNEKLEGVSIHYEHPTSGSEFPAEYYQGIIDYELHLRYFVQAQKWAGLPFAFHTVGSSFAVKAQAYIKYGGMNRKKAGEDFYFLQKIIPHGKFGSLGTTKIIPSPRPSDRVPFGTGASIRKMETNSDFSFKTYRFEVFLGLKKLVQNKLLFFKNKFSEVDSSFFEPTIWKFMEMNNFEKELEKINMHSPNDKIFTDRFYQWWNAFRTMKYLNWLHEEQVQKQKIGEAANQLLSALGAETKETNIESLTTFRKIDLK